LPVILLGFPFDEMLQRRAGNQARSSSICQLL
jgi:hypothetical protein